MSGLSPWWHSPTPVAPARDQTASPPEPAGMPASERCLFIIGAARSGSTVLQNALNDAPDIFLFGEPDFHIDAGAPGFAARYNAMHRSWANQENKSTFCPAVLPTDGDWRQYLARMSSYYRFVGAKLVINPVRDRDLLEQLFDFQCRNFYLSRYIFTFRAPLPTVMSTRELQMLVRGESDEIRQIIRSYAETARLYIRMLRNLPHVGAFFHEEAGRPKFEELERWLGVPLSRSHQYYDLEKIRKYPALDLDSEIYGLIAALEQIYGVLRRNSAAEIRKLQAEQNNNHLLDDHFTDIGNADRRLGDMIRDLAPAP